MSITRDMIQGFISGYKMAGGDMTALSKYVLAWLQANTAYPTTDIEQQNILNDLGSYVQ